MRRIEVDRKSRALAEAVKRGLAGRRVLPGGRLIELVDWEAGQPRYLSTGNANAAISTGADLLRPAPFSLTGSGVKIGLWDGGSALATHVEFGGRLVAMDGASVIDHATHVAGTLAASGQDPAARGMAGSATIASYDWINDISEMTANSATSAGEAGKIYLSNHSYNFVAGWNYLGGAVAWEWNGLGTSATGTENDFGMYNGQAREADTLAWNAPYYLIFRAAGNDRTENPQNGETIALSPGGAAVVYNSATHPAGDGNYRGGFDTIGFSALGKNIITIGSVSDAVSGGQRSSSAAAVSRFSSWGPTDDGRIKPDVVANGESVYSTLGWSSTAYGYFSGTSMASPSVCGSASLLIELYARLYPGQAMRASSLKGLLLHTADDLGQAGPDYKYGWGLMNVRAAAEILRTGSEVPAQPTLIESQLSSTVLSRTTPFAWDGVSPVRATLCWTDPAGNATTTSESRTSRLVNNLNLKLISPSGSVHLPYVMPFVGTWTQASMDLPAVTGTNNTDNVEQVYLAAPSPSSGLWQAVVSVPGSLSSTQTFSLILSGTAPTNPVVERITPDSAVSGPVPFTVSGSNFISGTTVHFAKTGESNVPATVASLTSTTLSGTLDVTNMPSGKWDVVVTHPDGRSGVLPLGFTVAASLWSQSFDGIYPGWSASASTGTSYWAPVTSVRHSEPYSWFAAGPSTKNTDNLVSESIAIPAGSSELKFSFQHRYNLSSGNDGGVLEFSIDGGTWFSLANTGTAEAISSGGYNVTLTVPSGSVSNRNEFAGKPAWSGNSGTAFSQVVVSLKDTAKYAGKSLRSRWRLGTNNSTASPGGWYVDSVELKGLRAPVNRPPVITSSPAASASQVTGQSTNLTVAASDDGGSSGLLYTWSVAVGPAAGNVSFSENGTPAARNTTVTFTAAGRYVLEVAVRDSEAATTVARLEVNVIATPGTVTLVPASATLVYGSNLTFSATVDDQFSNAIIPTPAIVWSTSGGGIIGSDGLFTPGDVGGPFNVTAQAGSVSGSAVLTITGIRLVDWQAQHFSTAEMGAGQHLDEADPDQDGVTNLTEYALGTDPRATSDTITVHQDATGQWIAFQRPKGLPDVIYDAATSTDLLRWDPIPVTIVSDGPVQTVRVNNPGAPNGQIGFIRVRFVRP